jgi:hypothetical protein
MIDEKPVMTAGALTVVDVRFWPKADIASAVADVRYWVQSRHPAAGPRLPFLATLNGHGRAFHVAVAKLVSASIKTPLSQYDATS